MPVDQRPVLVGVDGSDASQRALAWAVGEARRLGAPLRLVAVWAFPYFGDVPVGATPPSEGIDAARTMLDGALAGVRHEWSDGVIDGAVVEGAPGPALVELSATARLAVLGARGAGGFARLLLGSVSDYVLRHATCPVAIIRPAEHDATVSPQTTGGAGAGAVGPVVVGLDGSAASLEALAWGAAAARADGVALVLVSAWSFPVLTGPEGMAGPIPWFDVESEANDLLSGVCRDHRDLLDGLEVRTVARHGSPASVLLEEALGASLLVVGDHRRTGIARLLGSVATQLAHHASCPLVVMRAAPA